MSRFPQKKPSWRSIPAVPVTEEDRARWRLAWGLGSDMLYTGNIDPLPMPPGEPCAACQGNLWWIEAELPHRAWRCNNCKPAPADLPIKHWTLNDPVDSAERDAIANEAPERHNRQAGAAMAESADDNASTPKEDEWI